MEERYDAQQGYVSDGTDWDETRAETHPSAEEACDGWDNDCDGVADEGTWYRDAASDGTGYDTTATGTCGGGPVLHGGDCEDGNVAMKPGGRETCDGLDNDRSGLAEDPEDEDGDSLNRSLSAGDAPDPWRVSCLAEAGVAVGEYPTPLTPGKAWSRGTARPAAHMAKE